MSKFARLAQRLILLFGLAAGACSDAPAGNNEETANAGPGDVAAVASADTRSPTIAADLSHHLNRLRALEIFEVDDLVVASAMESADCYSIHPCNTANPGLVAEYRRQEPRLARLADLAERISASPVVPATDPGTTYEDLRTLDNLLIVEVGALITAVAPASPNCYHLPCADDVVEAAALNQRRADIVHALALAATREKL